MIEAGWRDVPGHRVLIVPRKGEGSLETDWDVIGEDGETWIEGPVALVRRKKDGRVFRPARWWPFNATVKGFYVLEEV